LYIFTKISRGCIVCGIFYAYRKRIRKSTPQKEKNHMAVILQERGRGKAKPAPDSTDAEIHTLLQEKLREEQDAFRGTDVDIAPSTLYYKTGRWNVLSLFSGAGGLDLGFTLAGLAAAQGEAVARHAFRDGNFFRAHAGEGVFHTVYVNDIFEEAMETYRGNMGGAAYCDSTDIRRIRQFPPADLVLGGFPCPGFSEAGPRLIDDKRNFLYLHFIRCLM
jgi:DNA (cytosine-5)-methyltransferase 1